MTAKPEHFKGKDALNHVAEAQALGMISSTEIHGTEPPGHWAAFADSARDMAMIFLLVFTLLELHHVPLKSIFIYLTTFSLAWAVWKMGRSAWLAWSRLERLHRLLMQEKWEIDHHRQQEREELKVLYAAKGFEGKLLEDVLDVLMADGDRLLRVMVEEELGLKLENQEHPLKQCLGSGLGSFLVAIVCMGSLFIPLPFTVAVISILIIALTSAFLAHLYGNYLVPSVTWSIGLAVLSYGIIYFLNQYLLNL